jgi:hypothetical protein
VSISLEITNTSNIVDGYRIATPGAPEWLIAEAGQLQLYPGTSESLPVRLRISSPTLVRAQQLRVTLEVRSMVQDTAAVELPLEITVPVVQSPVMLRPEPQLVRVRDQNSAKCLIIADNSRSNRPARLAFSASDPELAVRFSFQPEVLFVGPGASAAIEMVMTAESPEPGQEVSRSVTVIAVEDDRRAETQLTFQQTASPADPPVAVEVVPSLIRVNDGDSAQARVVLDNRKARSGVRIWMGATDPEQAITFTFTPPVVDVEPGRVLAVDLRLDAPRPAPGQEVNRPFTVTAADGRTTVQAAASLVQSSSRAAIETLTVSLDPSVLNLGHRRRGSLTAVLDNRAGTQPANVALYGDDPRNALRFSFSPPTLLIPPGRTAVSRVSVRSPGPENGREVTLPFDVIASDGRSEVRSSGSVIQAAADRRPLLRILFTLLGGLAMILGTYLPLRAADSMRAWDLTADEFAGIFNGSVDLGAAAWITVGHVIIALGILVMIGLVTAKGGLSRRMAVLGVMVVVGTLVTFAVGGDSPMPGAGAFVIILGCVAGFIGGRLVRT